MRITKVDIWSVVVPERPGSASSGEWGRNPWPDVPKQIIRINTDEGLAGIGETKRGLPFHDVVQAAARLEGRNVMKMSLQNVFLEGPLELSTQPEGDWQMDLGPYPPEYEAFEMAVFDLVGKRLGIPIHALLGGAVRDRVRVHYWMGQQTPKDSAQSARKAIDRGFNGIKIKCRLEEPNLERLGAVLDVAGPDFKVTVDPNGRFHSVDQTLMLAEELGKLGNVEMFEDPIPRPVLDHETLARFTYMRERLPFPLAITTKDPAETLRAVRAGAADYINLGGSMVNFVKCAAIADAASIPVWHGAGVDLGIMETSYAHVTGVAPNCVLANDIVGSWVQDDDLIVDGLRFETGSTAVPQSPGLGCELDMDALERYRVDS